MGLIPFEHQGGGHWLYTHLSARIPLLKTHLTAGLSHGSQHLFGRNDVLSFMGALEQPLGTPKLNLVAECSSGSHELANFIYELAYHPNHHWIFVVGHKIPTYGRVLTAAVVEVGIFLQLRRAQRLTPRSVPWWKMRTIGPLFRKCRVLVVPVRGEHVATDHHSSRLVPPPHAIGAGAATKLRTAREHRRNGRRA